MYNLYIPLCSYVLNVFLIILFLLKSTKTTIENNYYFAMIVDTFMMTVFCMFAVYLLAKGSTNYEMIKVFNKIECAFIFNFTANLLMYIIYVSKTKIRYIAIIYTFMNLLMIFLIFITPIELQVTSDLTYMVSIGLSTEITTIGAGVLLLITSLIALRYRENLKGKIFPVILLLLFIVVIVIIRSIKPEFICLEFLTTLATLIMFHTIENPDVQLIRELNIAREQAERANDAKTEFLSSMSHEIRTPLNAIVGFSQILSETDVNEEIKEEVKDILMASDNLLEIVNGILDISKIEANKIEIIESDYSTSRVINELVALTRARIGDKGLDFRVKIDDDLPNYLHGDHTRLKQIILNLLTNAVKYTKKGFIEFKVSSVIKDNRCNLTISIKDSGIGIEKDSISKMFEKFERYNLEDTISIEGTGLGLAITKKLVELMNGDIEVASELGKGSTFTVMINQGLVVEDKIPMIDLENTIISLPKFRFIVRKVLVVDDNKINLKVASKLLINCNVNVEEANSGFECIEKIKAGEKYDLILLDDMMPKMTGVETLKKLKEDPNFDIPTVALTANALSGMREKYLSEGFDDYLAKPIERKELNRVLKKFLDNVEL